MGYRLVALGLVLGALWDVFTTFHGVTAFFDLPMDPKINPVQFVFGLVVTMMVFGFVMATHLIWANGKSEETPALLVKAAWAACIAIDLFTSWEGTKSYVFYGDEGDAARDIGLAVVTALIVSSSIFLSKLLLEKSGTAKSVTPSE
jgi:tryptophan-rich sensory protein